MRTRNDDIISFLIDCECGLINFSRELKEVFDNKNKESKEYAETVASVGVCVENIKRLRRAARNNGHQIKKGGTEQREKH